ncbi:polysaccharide biosynthesis protein GumE [Sphingomonas oleivorans]|uniref:Polysaccharide biosynthesis protein GumE n=1 Tax=Sphingomonas oleivorans TaxID=1735121 RepID=A0A2T5FZ58_9SPHN|nr:polysaccharide biosynthesis protein GumE [Sphingomonas oleivorans]
MLFAALLGMTVLFNPLLALVNAQIFAVAGGMVVAIQGLIVIAALALGALQRDDPPYRWIALTWGLTMLLVAISAVRAELSLKNFGDILIIPAFICLGTRLRGSTLVRLVIALQSLLLLVGIWELASPAGFGATFKVISYYVNTRGFDQDAFWAGGDLFLSSERPKGRMLLDGFGLHRGSSLFLEPVSLGNWTIVIAVFIAAFWSRLSHAARIFLILSNAALLVICDGRLALSVNLVLLAYLPLARKIPGWASAFYLPGLFLLLLIAMQFGFLPAGGDTMPGRLRVGMDALLTIDLANLLGVGIVENAFADAGWAYFIQTQSLIAALAVWLMLTLTSTGEEGGGRMAKHGIAVFITLCLPISYSILSIKTVAVMWAFYGYFYARANRMAKSFEPDPAREATI